MALARRTLAGNSSVALIAAPGVEVTRTGVPPLSSIVPCVAPGIASSRHEGLSIFSIPLPPFPIVSWIGSMLRAKLVSIPPGQRSVI